MKCGDCTYAVACNALAIHRSERGGDTLKSACDMRFNTLVAVCPTRLTFHSLRHAICLFIFRFFFFHPRQLESCRSVGSRPCLRTSIRCVTKYNLALSYANAKSVDPNWKQPPQQAEKRCLRVFVAPRIFCEFSAKMVFHLIKAAH